MYLKVYGAYHNTKTRRSEWCYKNFVNRRALEKARDIVNQLHSLIRRIKIKNRSQNTNGGKDNEGERWVFGSMEADTTHLRKSLLTGCSPTCL